MLKLARFYLDCLDKDFPGFTLGETWNGFACPYFSFETAAEILGHYAEIGYEAPGYDVETDCFSARDINCPDDYTDSWTGVLLEGQKLYAIGAFSWVWEELKDEQ